VDNQPQFGLAQGEAEVATDLLAGLLIEQKNEREEPSTLPAKVWAVMAVTSLLTFTTLTTGYQLLFPHQLFA